MNTNLRTILALVAALFSAQAFATGTPMAGNFSVSWAGTEVPPDDSAKVAPATTPVLAPVKSQSPVKPPVQEVVAANPAPVPGVERAIPPAQTAAKRLPTIEQKRLAALRDWEASGVAEALVGQNGAIEYPYGYARPVISCAPLHVCTIMLMSGESITSLSLGDTVRWLAQQSTAGNKPVIVVKPVQAAISTNMVVTTDAGRVYYMHLVADKSQYVPMVSFYDPAAMMRQEHAAIAAAEAAKAAAEMAKAKRDQEVIASFKPGFDPAKLDFDYRCRGNEDLLPARVFGSETHTYLQMPKDQKAKDAPAVFAMRGEQTELVNLRTKGDYYVIDGRPAKFQLLLGVGSDQRAVTCERK